MPTENVRKPRTESCKLVLLRDHHTTTTPTTLVVFFLNKNFQIRVTNLCCFRGSHPDNKNIEHSLALSHITEFRFAKLSDTNYL